MKKILDYLHLRDVGIMELLVAMLPILVRYASFGIPNSVLVCFLLMVFSVLKEGKLKLAENKQIKIFICFYIVHEFLWYFVIPSASSSFIYRFIELFVPLMAILIVGRHISYQKLRGSLNWIAILSMLGMCYQFMIVLRGGTVTPLGLPFLSSGAGQEDVFKEFTRPMSFYAEPSVYAAFMLIPLFIAVYEKKYLWSAAIVVTIFMSASTTGLGQVFIIGISVIFTQKLERKTKLAMLIMFGAMAAVLLTSSLFSQSTTKVENTNIETTVRIVQGPLVVSAMSGSEYVLGVPYATANDFCLHNPIGYQVAYYGDSVYMTTFFLVLLRFGLIGLFLYLAMYWGVTKRIKELRPLMLALFVTLFTSAYFIGIYFVFQFLFIVPFEQEMKRRRIQKTA